MVRRGASGAEGETWLTEREITQAEKAHPGGMTVAELVEVFQSRGIKMSEATFRKYVQLGLVPRSYRVGRKGKHQGSLGLYPVVAVRRVNAIRQLMAGSHTVEEIQQSFFRFRSAIDAVALGFDELFADFSSEIADSDWESGRKQKLTEELRGLTESSAALIERVEGFEQKLISPRVQAAKTRVFSSGATSGASDLL